MKKTVLIISILLLVAFCGVMLCGCVSTGTYTFKSAKVGILSIDASDINTDAVKLTLNKDGTFTFSFSYASINLSKKGTWTKKGRTVTFKTNEGETTATYKNKELTWEYSSGYTFVFTK